MQTPSKGIYVLTSYYQRPESNFIETRNSFSCGVVTVSMMYGIPQTNELLLKIIDNALGNFLMVHVYD